MKKIILIFITALFIGCDTAPIGVQVTFDDEKSNAIEPDDIAQLVINILSMREGSVIDEINLSPLKKVIKFL